MAGRHVRTASAFGSNNCLAFLSHCNCTIILELVTTNFSDVIRTKRIYVFYLVQSCFFVRITYEKNGTKKHVYNSWNCIQFICRNKKRTGVLFRTPVQAISTLESLPIRQDIHHFRYCTMNGQ